MQKWTIGNTASQKGKRIVITGANSGIGFATTKALAKKGAEVVMAVRHLKKGKKAKNEILEEAPEARLVVMKLDLADLKSVQKFTADFKRSFDRLDVLINNAGIYKSTRTMTQQGFEAHFGVNYLGHFVLTLGLLSCLKKSSDARIVSVGSFIPELMKSFINWEDVQFKRNYDAMAAYGQSKLANMVFGLSLHRKLQNNNSPVKSIIVNPGFTKSGIKRDMNFAMKLAMKLVAQKTEMGILPLLRAATDQNVDSGVFLSPKALMKMRGYPKYVQLPKQVLKTDNGERLWQLSEKLSGIYNGV